MPANVYECMLLLDTNRVAGDLPGAQQQIHTILERNHCEILASRPWDERRLAYPVNGQKKGLYYLTYFKSEGTAIREIERDFSLNEMILRTLVIKVDPKHVDQMLAIARDENALALQVAPEPGEEGSGGDRAGGNGEDRPRRGGRRHAEEGAE